MQVHHLTYARIYKEEMADLLPLCRKHHERIEKLISGGNITRHGNSLFLATETVRLLAEPTANPKAKSKIARVKKVQAEAQSYSEKWYQDYVKKTPWSRTPVFQTPKWELSNQQIDQMAKTMDREQFKSAYRKLLPKNKRSKRMSQALLIFDRIVMATTQL